MNAFNIVIIALGICALCVFCHLITQAKEAGNDVGLFITHEELGKMREEWIEYGKKLGREELNNNSPCKPFSRNRQGL